MTEFSILGEQTSFKYIMCVCVCVCVYIYIYIYIYMFELLIKVIIKCT